MKLNTAKQGINRVWKNYEAEAISYLIERGEEGSGSGDVFSHVEFKLSQMGESISRASVIFFLNRLVDDGLVSFTKKTGKGGYHRVYKLMDRTWADFNETVLDIFLLNLGEIFPENERIQKINEVK